MTDILSSKIVVIALCLLPLIALWYYDYLPLQDYPNHYARLKIRSDYERSEFYRENFRIKFFQGFGPPPYLALDTFVDKLMFFLDTDKAMRLFISFYVVLYVTALYLLSKQLALDFSLSALMSLPLIYSYFFYAGLLNFLFSIPLFLFLVWVLENYETRRNMIHVFLLAVLSLAVYLTHIFAFFAFCVVLFCHLFSGRLKIRESLLILLAISPSLLLSIDFKRRVLPGAAVAEGTISTPKLLFLNFHFFHLPFNLFLISSMLFPFAVFIILRNSSFPRKRYLVAAATLFSSYFVLPAMGIDVRAVLFAMVILPLSLKVKDGIHVRIARFVLLTVFSIGFFWMIASFSDFNKNFSTRCAAGMIRSAAVLPIDVTNNETAITPYVNSWGYFLRQREVITPYLFSGFMVDYKKTWPAPSISWVFTSGKKTPYSFRVQYETISKESLHKIKDNYDYILLTGSDKEMEDLIGSVSRKECSSGAVSLYKVDKGVL